MWCCHKVGLRGQFFLSGLQTDSKKAISRDELEKTCKQQKHQRLDMYALERNSSFVSINLVLFVCVLISDRPGLQIDPKRMPAVPAFLLLFCLEAPIAVPSFPLHHICASWHLLTPKGLVRHSLKHSSTHYTCYSFCRESDILFTVRTSF